MKIKILFCLVVVFCLSGCIGISTGVRSASYTNSDKQTIKLNEFDGTIISPFMSQRSPDIGATMEHEANAYATKKDADTRAKISATGKYAQAQNGKLLGVINNSIHRVYFIHPEYTNYRIPINSKSSQIIPLAEIPRTLDFIDDTGYAYSFPRVRNAKKGETIALDGYSLDCRQVINTWRDGH